LLGWGGLRGSKRETIKRSKSTNAWAVKRWQGEFGYSGGERGLNERKEGKLNPKGGKRSQKTRIGGHGGVQTKQTSRRNEKGP